MARAALCNFVVALVLHLLQASQGHGVAADNTSDSSYYEDQYRAQLKELEKLKKEKAQLARNLEQLTDRFAREGDFFVVDKTAGRTCGDAGGVPILDEFFCEFAARALGLSDTTVETTSTDPRPEGCYLQGSASRGELWLSFRNTGTGVVGGRSPICSKDRVHGAGWEEHGPDHSRCDGNDGRRVSSQRACEQAAAEEGHRFYSYDRDHNRCRTAASCDRPIAHTEGHWRIYRTTVNETCSGPRGHSSFRGKWKSFRGREVYEPFGTEYFRLLTKTKCAAMYLDGQTYYGELDGDEVTWSDGDVWHRVDDLSVNEGSE